MYKKRIIKPQNSKISSEHQTHSSSKIIVHRTNSNKDQKIQKPDHITSQPNINQNNEISNNDIPTQEQSSPYISTKNYSLNSETVKKLLLSFYPEDKFLFDIILSPLNKTTFLYDLDKYYSKLEEFSNSDPFNKYYGVQNSIKSNYRESQTSIDLNKENTDIIFSLVDQLLASFGPKLNLNTIKGNINQIYKCHNLSRINFIANKEKNLHSTYPVNFYAFCITMRMLIECYSDQIKFFDMGIFMNSAETLFGKENNFCFLSELFCCYIVFLYFYSILTKYHDVSLTLHLFDDCNIYDNFTFHETENGFDIINNILGRNKDTYDVMTLLKEIFTVNLNKLNFFLHYDINIDTYKQIVELLNCQDYLTKVEFYCDKNFLNSDKFNIFKDMQKCTELNIYLQNTNNKSKIKLKDDMANVINFALEGNDFYLDNIPNNLNNLKKLKLVSNIDNINSPYYSDKYEKENICFNLTQDIFNNLDNIQELTLKYLSLEQFLLLVNCLNSKSNKSQSNILKLNIEVDYTFSNIIQEQIKSNTDNKINIEDLKKNLILKAVNLLINYSQRISNVHELSINLVNNGFLNNFVLSTENGLYFIELVLQKLQSCYRFSLINTNNNYFPKDEEKPDITLTGNGKRTRKVVKKKNENEEFYLSENKHKCRCDWNHNSEIFVSYNGNECNDFCKFKELDEFVPFLIVVDKKLKKLNSKPILLNIAKYFNITKKKPRILEVINFNN